jgi:hypothetical protein
MLAPPFPLWAWLVFVGIVLALLFLDLFVLHRNARGSFERMPAHPRNHPASV